MSQTDSGWPWALPNQPENIEACKAALATHDVLEAANEAEPECDEDSGMPFNAHAWLIWKEQVYDPAYASWKAAMDTLEEACGELFPGRHPFAFRPFCNDFLNIVSGRPGAKT